jgi:hypothetical protein
MANERICLRLDLNGVEAKRFIAVKEHLGFRINAEFVRVLVADKYRGLFGTEA